MPPCCHEISGTNHPVTRCNFLEEHELLVHCCDSLKAHIYTHLFATLNIIFCVFGFCIYRPRLIASCRQYDSETRYKLSQLGEKMVVNLNFNVHLARKRYVVDILDIACEGVRVINTTRKIYPVYSQLSIVVAGRGCMVN